MTMIERTRRIAARFGRSSRAQLVALSLVAGTLTVLAAAYDGEPIHDVEFDDGGVWVTNAGRGLVGRFNSQVRELDLAVASSSTADEVYQQGSAVAVFDDGGSPESTARSLSVIDVYTGTPGAIPLAGDYRAVTGSGHAVVLDRESGKVWFRLTNGLEGFDGSVPADATVSARSQVTVTSRGTMLVADRTKGTVRSWTFDEAGMPVEGGSRDFDTEFTDDAQLSAVGEIPVVLQAGKLYRPGAGAVEIAGKDPVVQQVGGDAKDVYVATASGLYRAGLDGGGPREVSGLSLNGPAAAPAPVAGCVHGAWRQPGTKNYVQVCGGDVQAAEIPDLDGSENLVFRSNRDVVVLNDTVNGAMWPAQPSGMVKISDWESVSPTKSPQQAEADDKAVESDKNDPPKAKPDSFGARPGATVVLPVTLNDVDPDGDILVITQPPAPQGGTTFSLVGDGTQIQARVDPNASGTLRFSYAITDGQQGHGPDEAEVEVRIMGPGTDTPPTLIKDQEVALQVAQGFRASVNVLGAYVDPEGDSVVLTGASAEGGKVGFRPDGTVEFADDGKAVGTEQVKFTLRGGAKERTFAFDVRVVDPDKAEPTTVADRFAGAAGTNIVLEPLANDTDPQGALLSLAQVRRVSGGAAVVVPDPSGGTASFRAQQPGSYYLRYVVTGSNGVAADPQTIRVDVVAASGANRTPIAMRDIAAVRPQGSALVDVLANDTDPDGDVLVVQGVRVADRAWAGRLKASLINKRFVRIETSVPLDGAQPTVEYLLSDGRSDQVVGAIAVTSAEAGSNRPPVVVEDVAVVRAGTVVTVPVLANDSDPDGDRVTICEDGFYDIGTSTVIEDRAIPIVATDGGVRLLVPSEGTSQVQIGYRACDPAGAFSDTRMVLNIKPATKADNQKPEPRPIEDRTVVGQRIRVGVGAFGSDPDGDPVALTGVVSAPRLGRIVATGVDWFDYEPLTSSRATGTDQFKVQVADRFGLAGIADVRIGVAPAAAVNQGPSTLDDTVAIRPGRTVQYPVLGNDSDPDGDALILERELSVSEGTKARVVDEFIEVEAPDGDDVVAQSVQYTVSDGLGGQSQAVLSVNVDPKAPHYAPTAHDDSVRADQLRDKAIGDTVDVDVLDNDGDLDGARDDLTLEPVDPRSATVVDRKLRVTLKADDQLLPYRITDADDRFSFGFVRVAGMTTMAPTLDSTAVPIEVTGGQTRRINLKDIIVVRAGHQPYLGNITRIAAAQGDATPQGNAAFDWRSPRDYAGSASVTLPVIDEPSLNKAGVLESQITVPITVLPAKNLPPKTRDTEVVVRAGADPVTLRLDRLATDPNKDDNLTFSAGLAPSGVEAKVTDDLLTLKAGAGASSIEADVTVTVSDGKAKATSTIRVTVIGRDGVEDEAEAAAAPMTLRVLDFPDARDKTRFQVDVASAVLFDPFPDKNKKLISVEASGPISASQGSGTTVAITPEGSGQGVVTYRLSDGSDDVNRAVEGRITVTVAAAPDAPGTPRAVMGGPDSIQLTWNAPNDNGSAITSYEVTGSPGGGATCQQTQCLISGLTPGKEYRFTVVAHNAVGPSKPSGASAPLTPDTVPDAMAAPVIDSPFTDRDGKLHLTWVPPNNEGSPIQAYEIEVAGGPKVQPQKFGTTAVTVEGLTNGMSYRVRIRAVNAKDPGPFSPWSAEQTPFTVPEVMVAPGIETANDNGDGQGFVTFTWAPVSSPADGFDPVTSYSIQLFEDDREIVTETVGGDVTRKDFTVENGHFYSARVRATNRAGDGVEFSPGSEKKNTWDRSGPVTEIVGTDCPEKKCAASTSSYVERVAFTTPADNGGYPVTAYKWSASGGGSGTFDAPTEAEGARTSVDLTFANIGAGQKVTLTPLTSPAGVGQTSGTEKTGGSFSPYALPFKPAVSQQSGGYMTARAGFDCSGGNGRSITSRDVDADGGASIDGCTASWSGIEGGSRRCATVVVSNPAGKSARSGQACGTADAKTLEVYMVSQQASAQCSATCYNVRYRVSGFASGNYRSTNIQAAGGLCDGDFDGHQFAVSVGGNGRGDTGGTATWFISGTCKSTTKVSITSGGVTGSAYLP